MHGVRNTSSEGYGWVGAVADDHGHHCERELRQTSGYRVLGVDPAQGEAYRIQWKG